MVGTMERACLYSNREISVTTERPFGAMFRAYRFHRGLTLRQLAAEIGVSSATLCRMESGKDPDAQTMLMVLAWLFGRRMTK